MTTLHITRGLPASGKSTFARAWVAKDPEGRVRVNRDDTRMMVFGKPYGLTGSQEDHITVVQHSAIFNALQAGLDVICDDTNLNSRYSKDLLKLAGRAGAAVEWHDEFLDVDVRTCIDRDAARTVGKVGQDVIMSFYRRYLANGKPKRPSISNAPDLSGFKPYFGTPGKPKVFLVDIDGTIASNGPLDRSAPHRSFYDWHAVGNDSPVEVIIAIVQSLILGGLQPLFVSGRDYVCFEETYKWIAKHVLGYPGQTYSRDNDFTLFMRAEGDNRRDDLVKLEIFDREIRDNYDVQFALDDRDQVVRAYRDVLGLTVLQVADGNF